MHIGVVIPAYNAAAWVGDAIASVLAQTHRDWSLVVVDDGSTDRTCEVAARFVHSRIRVIRQENAGVSVARNRGIDVLVGRGASPPPPPSREASGELPLLSQEGGGGREHAALFLDADDLLAPDALARLNATLGASSEAVAAVGVYAFVGGKVTRRPASGDLLERLLVRNLFANGGHLLVRTEALVGAGGFRPGLAYGEDWELWVRLALLGPFVATSGSEPVLFIRQHEAGAYRHFAANPASFIPCMNTIFGNPALLARFGPTRLAAIRGRAEAENTWVVGREFIRHGEARLGREWLCRSFRAAPSARRAALLFASMLRCGPFAPYARAGRENFACSDPTSPWGRKMMNTTSSEP